MPALAIVPDVLWEKAQARRAANARGAGRPARKGIVHVLSGLLRCGSCGSPMAIVGAREVGDRKVCKYGCSARQSRGETACSNRNTIAELRLTDAVMAEVRKLFTSPEYERWVQEAAEETQRARARAASRDDERAALDAEVRAAEKRVANVVESIASLGSNDLLAAKFRDEEKKLLDARQRLAASVVPKDLPPARVVSTAQVLKAMDALDRLVQRKPADAKEALASIVQSIVLTPGADGYTAKLTLKTEQAALSGGLFVQTGCGGRI